MEEIKRPIEAKVIKKERGGKERRKSPKITKSLSLNLLAPEYIRTYEFARGETLEAPGVKGIRFNQGEAGADLGRKDIALIRVIMSEYSKLQGTEQIEWMISKREDLRPEANYAPSFVLDLFKCSKALNNGGTRAREIKDIYERICKIAKTNRVQIISGMLKGNKTHMRVYTPYIMIGQTITQAIKGEEIPIAVKIFPSRIFLEGLDSHFIPLNENALKLKKRDGTQYKDTLLRWSLLSELEHNYNGRMLAYKRALEEERARLGGSANKENFKESRKALYFTLNLETIKQITPADYERTRKRRAEFYGDLEDALEYCKAYGIIRRGRIYREEGKVLLEYNPDFSRGQLQIAFDEDLEI